MSQMMQQESSYVKELEKRAEKKQQEITLKQQRADMDKRIENLRQTMLEYVKDYGIEDYRTQMMISLHDMALQMKETSRTIEAFNQVSLYIGETIGFIDQSYDLMNNIFTLSSSKRYSIWQRIKNKMRMRKSIKYMKLRMSTLASNMANVQKISLTMSTSMKRATEQMKTAIARNNEKSQKEAIKRGEKVMAPEESPSLKICKEYLHENGENIKENGEDTSSSSNGTSHIVGPDQI